MNNITAVVVTYNRRELLRRCIGHLRKQTVRLDNIIVVNNGSMDGTAEWLNSQTDLQAIHQENVGGSGGLYRGIRQAYDDGYDWIWCVEDDAYPEANCVENLLKQNDDQTGILCPLREMDGHVFLSEVRRFNLSNPLKSLHVYSLKPEDVKGKEYVTIEGIAFEGPLIKREVVKIIGLPNKDLFLLYDDSDYSYRAVLAGYQIRLVTKAKLNKELFFADVDRVTKVQKGKWKLYYQIRNGVYFNQKYGKNFGVRTVRSFGIMMKYQGFVLKNLLFNKKYELSDLKVFYNAYRDGMTGRLGKKNDS